eukprot:Colp12_sorted_trinity150504_noHs@11805
MGWVKGADLVFHARKTKGDYHEEMNGDRFMKWWQEQLLPNLPANACIVIDNASYHNMLTEESRPVNSKLRKAEIIEWLAKRNIPHDPKMLRKDLYLLARANSPTPVYLTDVAAKEAGKNFLVLRLPVAHCELNPIELMWAQVKHNVAVNNTKCTMVQLKSLVLEAFEKYGTEYWINACRHAEKFEQEYIKMHSLSISSTPLIIRVEDDDDDDDEMDEIDSPMYSALI